MSVGNYAGPLGEIRGVGAGSGVALTTTAALTALPNGTRWVKLEARNFSTAVVARLALNPYLVIVEDANGTYTDDSDTAQDGDTSTTFDLDSMDTAANSHYLYVGAHVPFRGVKVDLTNVNGTASVLTVRYWDGSAWTDISDTDGTASGGVTLAQDGDVTWTVPTDWAPYAIAIGGPYGTALLYWTRWEVSVQLDADVTIAEILAYNRSTAYAEVTANLPWDFVCNKGVGGIGTIEALTNAGTANLLITAATRSDSSPFA